MYLEKNYQNELKNPEKAKFHEDFLEKNIKGEITIVSGLPRSGTSMMMQILDAAGMDMLTDKKRKPDNNNPQGYYEFEPVKRLMIDKSWLPEASGKTVKIIAQLLPFLPVSYNYKIIFMRKLVEGGSEHSFGIHVAKMAGMPSVVVSRAKTIMKKLEKTHSQSDVKDSLKQSEDDLQLSIFQLDDPVLKQIRNEIVDLDVNTLTPVEALIKLNEIKKLSGL